MAAAGHSEESPDRAAAALTDAEFVRLVATADGDGLAAAGLLARGLDAIGIPYQASLAAVPEPPATDADCTVAIGHSTGDVTLRDAPIAVEAASILDRLAPEAVDPELALAGAVAAGAEPSGRLLERADVDRRPGVAIPTDDPVEGFAYSTLVHAGFSGDTEATEAALAELEETTGRALASFVALAAVEDAPPQAAEAVERALRPHATPQFGTLGGFADVLDAVARIQPGTGLALALGHDVETAARTAWRTHGKRAHTALRTADTGRYEGLYVLRIENASPALLGTVARLAFQYRSPEPIAAAVTGGAAAAVGERTIETPLSETATALGGRASARDTAGTVTFDGTPDDFTAAFRRAI
jgi:hypothetical protein